MKKYSALFLILTLLTGVAGFAGINFTGIEVVRVLFLISADLLVISLLAKLFFREPEMETQS